MQSQLRTKSAATLSTPHAPRRAAFRAAAEAYSAAAAGLKMAPPCPCDHASLCKQIAGAPAASQEIFGFVGGDGSGLDLSRVTTIAWLNDPKLMCAAHKAGARVVLAAPQPETVLAANASARAAWVAKAVSAVVNAHADGMTFDWESPCAAGCAAPRLVPAP